MKDRTPLDRWLCGQTMTAAAFARRIGVLPPTLSRIRSGKHRPTLEQAVAIQRETGGAVPVEIWLSEVS